MIDRYHHVGLNRNPFAANTRDGIEPELFVSRGLPEPPPPRSKTLVQVIGDQGAGKTTHLRQWRRSAPGPYHYIPPWPYRDRWGRAPIGPLVYGDEIDRMPRPLRRRWFGRLATVEATLIIGTHVDLARLGRRFGFDVVTHRLPPLDRAVLAEIVRRRLDRETLAPGRPTFRFEADDIDRIFERCGGSLVEAEVLCHKYLAERVN